MHCVSAASEKNPEASTSQCCSRGCFIVDVYVVVVVVVVVFVVFVVVVVVVVHVVLVVVVAVVVGVVVVALHSEAYGSTKICTCCLGFTMQHMLWSGRVVIIRWFGSRQHKETNMTRTV